MAARKPASVTTQLKAALATAQDRIKELETKLKSEEQSKQWAYSSRDDAVKELEQTHAIIDVLPGAIPRTKADGYSNNTAAVRIASWLASKQ